MLLMEKIINKKYLDEFGLIERGYYLNKPQCTANYYGPIRDNLRILDK